MLWSVTGSEDSVEREAGRIGQPQFAEYEKQEILYMTMIERKIKGAYGIMATPFLENGTVDYEQIEKRADELCETELSGIVICGSTSEFVMLSQEDNKEIMRIVAGVVQKRKPLVCGATAPDSRTCIDYLDYMSELGADAALIAPPYYFTYSGDEVIEFYKQIDHADCSAKIIAYQIPTFSSPIPLEKTKNLMSLQNVIGLKNSSANIKQIMHQINIRNEVRPEFSILTGTDDALIPCLVSGCDGSFTALASIFPEEICSIYQAIEREAMEDARAIQDSLLPVIRLADKLTFPIGYKFLAEVAGVLKTAYRQSLSADMLDEIETVKEQMADQVAMIRQR